MKKIRVIDIFCGAGGASTGISRAVAWMNQEIDLTAVDQNRPAIETHTKNHPGARHICMPVEDVDLSDMPESPDLLWASPPCVEFSTARSSAAKDPTAYYLAWEVMRWVVKLKPRIIIIENVLQFQNWGPLDENNCMISSRYGETFRKFCSAIEEQGYSIDCTPLCAADYGDATTRKRFFIQATRKPRVPRWPMPTHSNYTDMFNATYQWIPVREIIDWSIPGNPINDQKTPFCPNTMRRIKAGVKKFWNGAGWYKPFLIAHQGTKETHITNSASSIDTPIRTILAGGIHNALVIPSIIRDSGMPRPPEVPVSRNHFTPVYGDANQIQPLYRFLTLREIASAQGFPAHYSFTGVKKDVIRQIGNAVPVNLATALASAALGEMEDR